MIRHLQSGFHRLDLPVARVALSPEMYFHGFPDARTSYRLISCDCPFGYDATGVQGAAENHYKTVSTKMLALLPMQRIAADSCILVMWASSPTMEKALYLIECWGFEFKTILFVWEKTYKSGKRVCGLGWYTRTCAEFVLVATRGTVKISEIRQSKTESQLITTVRGAHSVKPDEYFDSLRRLFGRFGPCIDVFARRVRPGWDAWGDQIPGTYFHEPTMSHTMQHIFAKYPKRLRSVLSRAHAVGDDL